MDHAPQQAAPDAQGPVPGLTAGARGGTAYVTLAAPLPCTVLLPDGRGATGFVRALAPDRLLAVLADQSAPTRPTLGACRLTVALPEGRTYDFEGRVEPAPADVPGAEPARAIVVHVESGASSSRLIDLLHLVRKGQHIHICATMDVEASDRYTGFSDVTLVPRALPELSWDELDPKARFLGRTFPTPLLVTGMTGGIERGAEINRRLAVAAARFGVPMGVGSQRLALENPEHAAIFAVKKHAPELFLIGNLGFAQLRGRPVDAAVDDCRRAVAMIEADCLAIHVNVIQEVVQVEGDRDFRGAFAMLEALAARLEVPLLVKEVGSGIDAATAARLADCGVRAIDVGGKGGTSWSFIEGARASAPATRRIASTFRDWGIPTAIALAHARRALERRGVSLVATGGVRDGLAVAKAVALGADAVGIGLPLFRAALESEEGPHLVLEELLGGLKTAMIGVGARDLAGLQGRLRILPRFQEQLAAYE